MKKKLFLTLSFMLIAIVSQAQIKVWNFAGTELAGYDNVIGDNTKIEAILYSSGVGVSGQADTSNNIGNIGTVNDKVFYVSGGQDRLRGNVGGITRYNDETKTIFEPFFGVGVPYGRLYVNGSGSDSSRYFGFNLAIGESITMYYYIDTSVAENLTIASPDGNYTNIPIDNVTSKIAYELHLNATDATTAGLYKVYSGAGKLCVGRIYETNITLGLKSNSLISTNIQVVGNTVYLTNVNSNTEINVYSMSGSLVKSLKTKTDTNFDLNLAAGVYVVKAKSAEGEKSIKAIIK
jgi:hypothetical protein